jgi:hypothetical protein
METTTELADFDVVLDAVDLLLWKDDLIVGGSPGRASSGNTHRALEIGPARSGPLLWFVTHKQVNNESTIKFYLSQEQVEQLRTYLQGAPAGK